MTRKNHPPATVRCAIYTRKSTEEGLDQDFNSLDAQRESAEAYIKSQAHEGWIGLPDHYDDGGFTGGNIDRPALAHLLADIEAGRIDAVVSSSNVTNERLARAYPVARQKFHLVRYGRNWERFVRSDEVRRSMRASLDIPDGEVAFGVIGRLDPQKGIREFAESLLELAPDPVRPSFCTPRTPVNRVSRSQPRHDRRGPGGRRAPASDR